MKSENTILVKLVNGPHDLWKFEFDYTIPEHLYAATTSLNGFMFKMLRQMQSDNPVLKAVKVAGKEAELLRKERNEITAERDGLLLEIASLELRKQAIEDFLRASLKVGLRPDYPTKQEIEVKISEPPATPQPITPEVKIPRWLATMINKIYNTKL